MFEPILVGVGTYYRPRYPWSPPIGQPAVTQPYIWLEAHAATDRCFA